MDSDNLQTFQIPGTNYKYTAINVESIESIENTLVTGLFDESGSTQPFAKDIENMMKEIVKSCSLSPRADNLIYRQCQFNSNFREFHGYIPVLQLNESRYENAYCSSSTTHLYDSVIRAIDELLDYSQTHNAYRYSCNGLIFTVTDGMDVGSTHSVADVKAAHDKVFQSESLESFISILIGVNNEDYVQKNLKDFQSAGGFTHYISLREADANSLAKLGKFISESILSQSQALGTNGPSQSIQSMTF